MTMGLGPVVDVRAVSRDFPAVAGSRTLFRVLRDSVKGRRVPSERRHALVDISLTAARGDKIAIIGNNAAGKSTLLRIIAGLLRPTTGTVRVSGDMVLLTSLGVGMIDEVTVYDNTMLYGSLYGVEPACMRAALADVFEWAGITGYAHAKLKTLSTGTRARLAFSVVRHMATDVFLIDEALSAGDVTFRAKCRAFFDEPRNQDRTFLVATHDMEFAQSFCTMALWLHRARAIEFGDSRMVVERYLAAQSLQSARATTSGAAR
ncbi:MAG: ABC transporter ATP-binding protein [Gemmatimonadota bacterium]|nr:ABC transporter ATP-binding protein [Gemmatimonadota bacterium]